MRWGGRAEARVRAHNHPVRWGGRGRRACAARDRAPGPRDGIGSANRRGCCKVGARHGGTRRVAHATELLVHTEQRGRGPRRRGSGGWGDIGRGWEQRGRGGRRGERRRWRRRRGRRRRQWRRGRAKRAHAAADAVSAVSAGQELGAGAAVVAIAVAGVVARVRAESRGRGRRRQLRGRRRARRARAAVDAVGAERAGSPLGAGTTVVARAVRGVIWVSDARVRAESACLVVAHSPAPPERNT